MRRLENMVFKTGLLAGVLCAGLIFGLGWTGFVLNPLSLGRARTDRAVEHAVGRLETEFEQVERTGAALDALRRSCGGSTMDPDRIAAIHPFLDPSGLLADVILWQDGEGTVFATPSGRDWDMVKHPAHAPDQAIFRAKDGRWSKGIPSTFEKGFTPEERPWFQAAEAASQPVWTPSYRFTPTESGYTYVRPLREKGRLVNIIALDVTLAHLERRVKELLPPAEFQVILRDRGGLALTTAAGPATPRQGPFRYRRTAALRPGAPSLVLDVVTMPGTLVPGQGTRIAIVILAALASFAAVMAYAIYLDRRIVRPIRRMLRPVSAPASPSDTASSDIWEFRQLQDSIRRLGQTESDRQQILNQLEHAQRVATVGVMAPGVIHDLNNHLSVILAQLNLCLEETGASEKVHSRIGKAERATMRCAHAMRGLLEFSRPGSGRALPFGLNELVMGTAALLEPVLGETITVETNLEEDLPLLHGEPVKLQQVVVNLALNAKDAMRGCGHLALRTWSRDGEVFLEVRDTGSGMTEEVKRKLFDPFFTTKADGKGTGLGLTMVYRIVTAHGGSVRVDSEPGSGTCFVIQFPVATALELEAAAT